METLAIVSGTVVTCIAVALVVRAIRLANIGDAMEQFKDTRPEHRRRRYVRKGE